MSSVEGECSPGAGMGHSANPSRPIPLRTVSWQTAPINHTNSMKTFISLLLPMGFGAIAALPIDLEIVGSLFVAAGVLFIMRADYGRRFRTLETGTAVAASAAKTHESLRLAA